MHCGIPASEGSARCSLPEAQWVKLQIHHATRNKADTHMGVLMQVLLLESRIYLLQVSTTASHAAETW